MHEQEQEKEVKEGGVRSKNDPAQLALKQIDELQLKKLNQLECYLTYR
jgi:hypothetical protein